MMKRIVLSVCAAVAAGMVGAEDEAERVTYYIRGNTQVGTNSGDGWATSIGGAKVLTYMSDPTGDYRVPLRDGNAYDLQTSGLGVQPTPANSTLTVMEGATLNFSCMAASGTETLYNLTLEEGSVLYCNHTRSSSYNVTLALPAMTMSMSSTLRLYNFALASSTAISGTGTISAEQTGTMQSGNMKIAGDLTGFTGSIVVKPSGSYGARMTCEMASATAIPSDPDSPAMAKVDIRNGATLKVNSDWTSGPTRAWFFGDILPAKILPASGKTVRIEGPVYGSKGFVNAGAGTVVLAYEGLTPITVNAGETLSAEDLAAYSAEVAANLKSRIIAESAEEGGQVSFDGGTTCAAAVTNDFMSTATVSVTAVPAAGRKFLYWTGDTDGFRVIDRTVTFSAKLPRRIVAHFRDDVTYYIRGTTQIASGASDGWATSIGGANVLTYMTDVYGDYRVPFRDGNAYTLKTNGNGVQPTPANSTLTVMEGATLNFSCVATTGTETLYNLTLEEGSVLYCNHTMSSSYSVTLALPAMTMSMSSTLRLYNFALASSTAISGTGTISAEQTGKMTSGNMKIAGDLTGFTGSIVVKPSGSYGASMTCELPTMLAIPSDPASPAMAKVDIQGGATLKVNSDWTSGPTRAWYFGDSAPAQISPASGKTVRIEGPVYGSQGFVNSGAGTVVLAYEGLTPITVNAGETLSAENLTAYTEEILASYKHQLVVESAVAGCQVSLDGGATWSDAITNDVAAESEVTLTAGPDARIYGWRGFPADAAFSAHGQTVSFTMAEPMKIELVSAFDATHIWSGAAGDGAFETAENWEELSGTPVDAAPGTTSKVYVPAGSSLKNLQPFSVASLVLGRLNGATDNAVFTVKNGSTTTNEVSGDVVVLAGGTLQTAAGDDKLKLVCGGDFAVEVGGVVSVLGPASGPGYSYIGFGAAYGGMGTSTDARWPAKRSYGSVFEPYQAGSGSGADKNGGGYFFLDAAGDFRVDGTVKADGLAIAGSGGGILARFGTLKGAGVISACGAGVSGAGGRIALYQRTAADWSAFSGQVKAVSTTDPNGGAGTVYRELPGDGPRGGTITISGYSSTGGYSSGSTDLPMPDDGDPRTAYARATVVVENATLDITNSTWSAGSSVKVRVKELVLLGGARTKVKLEGHTLKVLGSAHRSGKGWEPGDYETCVENGNIVCGGDDENPGKIVWGEGLMLFVK